MMEGSEECYSTERWEWHINILVRLSVMLSYYLHSTRKHFIVRQIPSTLLCLPKRKAPSSRNISLVFFIAGGDFSFSKLPWHEVHILFSQLNLDTWKAGSTSRWTLQLYLLPSHKYRSYMYLTKHRSSVSVCKRMIEWMNEHKLSGSVPFPGLAADLKG